MPTPSLTLDWSSGSLPGSVTHGGGANGSKWSSSGFAVAGSSGRITWDPGTLQALGLLAEEARTNYAFSSQALGSADWALYKCTVTADNVTSPDNTADADTIVGGTTTADATEIFGAVALAVAVTTKMAY